MSCETIHRAKSALQALRAAIRPAKSVLPVTRDVVRPAEYV